MAPVKSHSNWGAYGVYLLVALAVMLPLLGPGFILTLDIVFTPVLRMPSAITSSYLFHALLHVLNIIVPSDIIEKGILLSILLLSSIGMHRLVRAVLPATRTGEWDIYIASIFFAINPYTYSRLMAGQYAVLLGYALLPWFVRLLLIFGRQPDRRGAIKLGMVAGIIGTISIHTLGELAILSSAAFAVALWLHRDRLRSYARYGILSVITFFILCGFWLVPLAFGHGKTAATINGFTAADAQAFSTTGGSPAGKLGNVLRLQGFWAEDRNLFLLPQDRTVLWGLMAIIIIALVITGATRLWRVRPAATLCLAISAAGGIVLAIGFMSNVLNAMGYREPQKFIGLLALAYSVFLAQGIPIVLGRLQAKTDTAYAAGAVMLLALPLLFTRVMFWGASGQLVPRQYPADWQRVNQHLTQDSDHFAAIFLPWHEYMTFQFAGRIIASPAPEFFDKPVIASQNPELGGATSGLQDTRHRAIENMLQNPKNSENFGRQLTQNNIKYVLLAKELDYRQYTYVTQRPVLRLVKDYPDIALYENTAWRKK